MLDKISLTIVLIGLGTWVTLALSGAIALIFTLLTDKDIELGDKSKRYIAATLVFGLLLVIVGYVMHGIDVFLIVEPSNFF